jgi:ribosomal protein L11 methyltransferase
LNNVAHDIIITPKMSFGTGHHDTTFMMIQLMENINFHNKKILDFGTGTGLLAILAEKLGSQNIKAIDFDKWSIENAEENIRVNDCVHIDLQLSSQLPEEFFEIILANINLNVILESLSSLKKILVKDGLILFSGLLVEDENIMINYCTKLGLYIKEKRLRNNWLCLLFINAD